MNELTTKLFGSIDKENFIPLVKSFSLFFFVLASWYAIRPVRNEFAVQVGAYDLSSLLGIVLVVMVLLIPIYSWIVSRLSAKNVLTVIYSFLIINLLLFISAWYFIESKSLIAKVFYVWCNVYSFFVVSIFWVEMLSIFKSEEAKKYFGIISAGGSSGAFFGSSFASYFSTEICGKGSLSELGPLSLIFFSVVCLLIAIFISRSLSKTNPQSRNLQIGGSSLDAFKSLFKDSLVSKMTLYTAIWTGLMTVGWLISLGIINEWSSDSCERTAFFARIEQFVTPLTLIMQLFVTSYVLRNIGPAVVLVTYGILLGIIFVSYASYPVISTVMILTIGIRVFEYGICKPTRETIYTGLNSQGRFKSTVMIDTAVSRGGDWIGGMAVRSLMSIGIVGPALAWAAVPIAGILSFVGYKAAKESKI